MAPLNDPAGSPVPSRWGLSFVLSGIMIFIYFGFILLIAWDRPLLGRLIVPGLSVGIAMGAFVIVSAWALTYIYVASANKREGK